MVMMTEQLALSRCPHCSVATPLLYSVWSTKDGQGSPRSDGQPLKAWRLYLCTTCGGAVTAEGHNYYIRGHAQNIYPDQKTAHEDIPEVARNFLQQAFNVLHAPDAAAVMAGSAVDAMLKSKDYTDGSLYKRIDQALEDGVLTHGMSEWAHSVRLGSNRPRHADENNPHVSYEEAKQSVEFAEALGNFLFVLTAKIERGIAAAKGTD
ncbi:MAG: DUF4145 domain-containing protein [Agrobacterium cavarae]